MSWFLNETDPIIKLSIIPRTKGALGFSQYLKNEEIVETKTKIINNIKFLLGGRIAEILFIGYPSTAAQDDLQKAFSLMRKFVIEFGMTER